MKPVAGVLLPVTGSLERRVAAGFPQIHPGPNPSETNRMPSGFLPRTPWLAHSWGPKAPLRFARRNLLFYAFGVIDCKPVARTIGEAGPFGPASAEAGGLCKLSVPSGGLRGPREAQTPEAFANW